VDNRRPIIWSGVLWSGVLIAAMLGLSGWAWLALPTDGTVPVHWGLNDLPD